MTIIRHVRRYTRFGGFGPGADVSTMYIDSRCTNSAFVECIVLVYIVHSAGKYSTNRVKNFLRSQAERARSAQACSARSKAGEHYTITNLCAWNSVRLK